MLKFVGDICLSDNDFDKGYGVGSMIQRGLNPFHDIQKHKGEFWIGNMECVLSNISDRSKYNRDCFRAAPNVILKDNLIDCYSVANNHIMEHGISAFNETIKTVNSNKITVGDLENKNRVVDHDGKLVAISAFSFRCDNTGNIPGYWYNPELASIYEEYNKVCYADVKVAYIHWGVEFVPYPYMEQQKIAHSLIDMGYDLIIGVHPHVLQGYEIYKGRHIFYSIGNFIFNMSYPDTNYGAIVSYNLRDRSVNFEYLKIGSDYSPSIVDEKQVPRHLRFDYLNGLIGKNPNIEQYSRAANNFLDLYRKYHHIAILKHIFDYDINFLKGMVCNFLYERIKR